LKEIGHLGDLGIDYIRMDVKEIGCELKWIHLAQDRVQWRGLMNTAVKLVFHKRQGIF
jgi:hypothetical protein